MRKNIAIATITVLAILCLTEGIYIIKLQHTRDNMRKFATQTAQRPLASGAVKRPAFLTAGMKFAENPLFSQAYKIVPGEISEDAKKALIGWDIKQTLLVDGSIQVHLVPHEAEDVQQEFIIKPGYSLYFIEMNLADDTTGKDMNRGDDMGVLVDQNGIIQ